MRDLYKLLQKLEENKIYFCIQSQGKNTYTNISVDDPKGNNRSFSHKESVEVEKFLITMWGHLINPMQTTFSNEPVATSKPMKLPVPSPMPMPTFKV